MEAIMNHRFSWRHLFEKEEEKSKILFSVYLDLGFLNLIFTIIQFSHRIRVCFYGKKVIWSIWKGCRDNASVCLPKSFDLEKLSETTILLWIFSVQMNQPYFLGAATKHLHGPSSFSSWAVFWWMYADNFFLLQEIHGPVMLNDPTVEQS